MDKKKNFLQYIFDFWERRLYMQKGDSLLRGLGNFEPPQSNFPQKYITQLMYELPSYITIMDEHF